MDERVIRFRVGAVVLFTFFAAAFLILLFGEGKWNIVQPTYTLYVHFSTAPGVTRDTPVRKDGLLIGRVVDVRFANQDDRFKKQNGVNVTMHINSDVVLTQGEMCRITYATFFGDSILEFVPGMSQSTEQFADGAYLEGRVPVDPLKFLADVQGDLAEAIQSVGRAGNEFGALSHRLNEMLMSDDDQLGRIVNKSEKVLDGMQRSLTNLDKIIGNEEMQANMRTALKEMPATLNDVRSAVKGVQSMTSSADRNLRNLEEFTKPLGDNGDRIVKKIDSSIGELNELLKQLVTFSTALNNSEGSLGQFVHNPELYDRANATMATVQDLVRRVRPILDDMRIFSDRLAREGIRGQLEKQGPLKR